MKHTLPIILGAGLFDSNQQFPKLTVTAPRTAQTYELEYFFEDGGISVLNGREFPIKRGNVLFAKPGDVRYSHLPFTCKFLHFTVEDPLLTTALDSLRSFFPVTDLQKTDAQFSSVISHFYSVNRFDNITAAAELISLLHLLGSQTTQSLSTILRAQRFIEINFRDDLSTECIAKACDVSVSYLHRLFKTSLGITPGTYLLSCRIRAARDLLINTSLPLSEIAALCGFNSQSYFSDCFKKNVGTTPNAFRKNATYQL